VTSSSSTTRIFNFVGADELGGSIRGVIFPHSLARQHTLRAFSVYRKAPRLSGFGAELIAPVRSPTLSRSKGTHGVRGSAVFGVVVRSDQDRRGLR
jgi:hypothetical protein